MLWLEVTFVDKNLEVSTLLDFYADLLTENQKKVLGWYYDEDLSLSEIGENLGITRQGVRDTIKKAEAQLFELEEKLHLALKFSKIEKNLHLIIENAKKLQNLSGARINEVYEIAEVIKNAADSIYKEQ